MNFSKQSLDVNKKSVEKSEDTLNGVNPNDSKLSINKSKDSIQYQYHDSKGSTNIVNDINYSNSLTELNQHVANKTDNRRYNQADI